MALCPELHASWHTLPVQARSVSRDAGQTFTAARKWEQSRRCWSGVQGPGGARSPGVGRQPRLTLGVKRKMMPLVAPFSVRPRMRKMVRTT